MKKNSAWPPVDETEREKIELNELIARRDRLLLIKISAEQKIADLDEQIEARITLERFENS